MAAYHCQQAVEKAVKAFLIHHGKPHERTHDIEVLVDLACEIDSTLHRLADAADALTPYATVFALPTPPSPPSRSPQNSKKPCNMPKPFTIS